MLLTVYPTYTIYRQEIKSGKMGDPLAKFHCAEIEYNPNGSKVQPLLRINSSETERRTSKEFT
ncbi:hypothetical protein Hanom_Chr15g01344591 [Helianthus anomalus]